MSGVTQMGSWSSDARSTPRWFGPPPTFGDEYQERQIKLAHRATRERMDTRAALARYRARTWASVMRPPMPKTPLPWWRRLPATVAGWIRKGRTWGTRTSSGSTRRSPLLR